MTRTPLQPLDPDSKRRVAESLSAFDVDSSHWTDAAVSLWLHFCHELKVTPEAAQTSDSFRKVLDRWAPIVARYSLRTCTLAAERNFGPKIAALSHQVHQSALKARSKAVQGEMQPLANLFG